MVVPLVSMMCPKNSKFCVGTKINFSGCIVNPRTWSNLIVSWIFWTHSRGVSLIKRSRQRILLALVQVCSKINGGFRIFFHNLMTSKYLFGMTVNWYGLDQINFKYFWSSILGPQKIWTFLRSVDAIHETSCTIYGSGSRGWTSGNSPL